MTNETLERHVTDELWWDPKIESEAIAVSADDGIVTLRGTVGSFRQKREAKRAAERVYGVRNVNNRLDVHVLTEHRRQDVEIRGDVLQALMLDTVVPTTIDATVKDGVVTLTGTAEWRYQRDEAEFLSVNVLGVDVENDVDILSPSPVAGEIHHSVTGSRTRRHARRRQHRGEQLSWQGHAHRQRALVVRTRRGRGGRPVGPRRHHRR
jgi:BON domain